MRPSVKLGGCDLPSKSSGNLVNFRGQMNRTCFPASAKLKANWNNSEVLPLDGGPINSAFSVPLAFPSQKCIPGAFSGSHDVAFFSPRKDSTLKIRPNIRHQRANCARRSVRGREDLVRLCSAFSR